MSSPVRWREDSSDASSELRQIMQHAQRQVPEAAQIEALTASVLAQLPAPPLSPAGASAAQTAAFGTASKLIVVGVLAGVGLASWWAQRDSPPGAAEARKAVHSAAVDDSSRPMAAQPEAAPTPIPVPQHEVQPGAAVPVARATRPVVAAQPSRRQQGVDAGREIELLHAARLAHRQAPANALGLLRQHERDFPDGALREEREALMIELLQYFDPEQATARLKGFEQRYPQSPYRESLRTNP